MEDGGKGMEGRERRDGEELGRGREENGRREGMVGKEGGRPQYSDQVGACGLVSILMQILDYVRYCEVRGWAPTGLVASGVIIPSVRHCCEMAKRRKTRHEL
jgi:hypothetical protein